MKKINLPVDAQEMRSKTSDYFNQGRSCSQSTLLGICATIDCSCDEKELLSLASGFGGGMGNTYDEGPCGALAAGVMALGMHFGNSTRCAALSRELYLDFKEHYGSPQCAKVIERVRNHACVGCCHTVVDKVAEILDREYSSDSE